MQINSSQPAIVSIQTVLQIKMPWKYFYLLYLTMLLYRMGPAQDVECETSTSCTGIILNHMVQIKGVCAYLRLHFRNMSEEIIPVGAFRLCRHTLVVDMGNNKIRSIKAGAFLGLVYIRELYLDNNLIELIEPGTFHTLTNLEVFVIADNRITYLPEYEFTSKKLRYFNLFHNQIKEIPATALIQLHSPQLIDLSSNELHNISPVIISNVRPGVKFVVNNNLLSNLALIFNITGKFKNTSILEASGNNIAELSNVTLGDFYKLRLASLDLSFNHIAEIKAGTFDMYWTLTSIYLSHNKIKNIPQNIFKNLQHLKELDLSYNQLNHYIFEVLLPGALISLNFSHNNIDRFVDFHWSLISNRRYVALDLSNNSISTLDANRVCRFTWKINIGYNKWNCSILYAVIHTLHMRGIQVVPGSAYWGDNVYGIPCERPSMLWDEHSVEHTVEHTTNNDLITTTEDIINNVNDVPVAALHKNGHCNYAYDHFVRSTTIVACVLNIFAWRIM